jgi:hypothetical protein
MLLHGWWSPDMAPCVAPELKAECLRGGGSPRQQFSRCVLCSETNLKFAVTARNVCRSTPSCLPYEMAAAAKPAAHAAAQ